MRWLGALLLLISGGIFTARIHFMKPYVPVDLPALTLDFERADFELKEHDRNMTIPVGGPSELDRMRKVRAGMKMEILRRKYNGDVISWGAGILGAILFGLSFRENSRRGRKGKKGRASELKSEGVWETSVPEATPREVYVDDNEYERRTEGGFPTRDEAVEWLLKDPLLKCDYCGEQLRPTGSSARETLELVTFYKKVPEGAKDLRIILGSLWFTRPAAELKCSGCERLVKR